MDGGHIPPTRMGWLIIHHAAGHEENSFAQPLDDVLEIPEVIIQQLFSFFYK